MPVDQSLSLFQFALLENSLRWRSSGAEIEDQFFAPSASESRTVWFIDFNCGHIYVLVHIEAFERWKKLPTQMKQMTLLNLMFMFIVDVNVDVNVQVNVEDWSHS